MFSAVASAATFNVTASASAPTGCTGAGPYSLASAVSCANTATSPSTIVLAAGNYSPTATLALTNTAASTTIQGPTPSPTVAGAEVDIAGGSVVPTNDSVISVATGVTLNLDNVVVSGAGGGSNQYASVDDFGTINTQGVTAYGNNGAFTVEQGGTGNIVDTTLAANNGTVGLEDLGSAILTNDTVTNNALGGIDNSQATSLTLINTIDADNASSDCTAHANTATTSIDSDGTCGAASTGHLIQVSHSTALLANSGNPSGAYGGVTPTLPPVAGSAAIGAGTLADAPLTDQRGYAISGAANIGSVQTGPGPTLNQAGTTEHFVGTVPVAESYTATWTATAFPIVTASEACAPLSGSTFTAASTSVDCTASDVYGTTVGSTATPVAGYDFTVAINPATPPTVTITPTTGTVTGSGPTLTTTVSDSTNAAGSIVTWTDSSLDAIDGTSDTVTCTDAGGSVSSGARFPIGSTTVTCSATNTNHLTGTATLIIVVNDTSAPVVTVPQNITQTAAAGSTVTVNYSPAPSATDLVDGTSDAVTCTIPASPGPTAPFPSGSTLTAPAAGMSTTTTVTCSATDTNHLTGTASFTVTINGVSPSAPSQNGLITGEVSASESLTPLATCDLGQLTPGVTSLYHCTTSTNATSTYAHAYVTVQDVASGDTTGEHLVNGTASLASPFTTVASSAVGVASPETSVVSAPTLLLTYNSPVTNDPVTLTVHQPVANTETLLTGTYAATVQLTISQTP